MESMLVRIKVAVRSLREVDELLNSLPGTLDPYDKAQATYVLADLDKVKMEMGKGVFQTALKTAITKAQKALQERS